MPLGVGGGQQLGVALEATSGTYLAPVKFVPFNSHSLNYVEDKIIRRTIKRSVGITGIAAGFSRVEGEVAFDATEDVVSHFMYASRMTVVKSGSTPNFTYTGTPSSAAIPVKTMSVTVEAVTGVVLAFTGCLVSSFKLGISDGVLVYSCSMIGADEASQSAPSPTFPTTTAYGPGTYSIEFPTGSPVTDTDTFEWSVEDNATPQYRLKNPGRAAQFVSYGERSSMLTVERDFQTRSEFDAYKATTSQTVTLTATKGANNSISILMPVSIKTAYEITGGGGQGELVRARITYTNIPDASGNEYTLTVKTQENIV